MQPEFPLLTPRLLIRPVQAGDKAFFYQLYRDWRVAQQLLRIPAPFTEAHAQVITETAIQGFAEKHTYTLMIEAPQVGKCVGVVTLRIPSCDPSYSETERAEDHGLGILGYSILPRMWGHGYASESAGKVVEWGFHELDLDRIQASALKMNPASRRILERLGFVIVEADILEEPLHSGPPQLGDRYMLYRAG